MIPHQIDTTCPYCGRNNDLHTNLTDPDQSPPRDGDYALCVLCGKAACFMRLHGVENLILRQLTDEEHAELANSEDYAYVQRLISSRKERPR